MEIAPSEVLNLTRERCLELMDQLIDVGQDYSDWGPSEFLTVLPDKYSLSFIILRDGIAGYTIMSRKWPKRIHIHHFMVHHAKRSLGLGQTMLHEARRRAGIEPLSLKVPTYNVDAIRFYERHGFTIEKQEHEIYWMLNYA